MHVSVLSIYISIHSPIKTVREHVYVSVLYVDYKLIFNKQRKKEKRKRKNRSKKINN